MTTYPLPTLAAQVTGTGITAPSYTDILLSLQASFQQIFGVDAYLQPDSQDGQLLAIFAQAINDCNQTAIAVYNQFSPATAQGNGLASVVKINGLQKLVPSNSTVNVTLVGVAGTIISNGIVQDSNGNQWNLPASVTIPIGGSIIVTATAIQEGAIATGASTVTQIITPTRGWQTVNNVAAAVPGAPVESDATLRKRQAVSTALPSQSIIGGIIGAVANITGVTQSRIYENDTDTTDANGLPEHSISVVVEGGDAATIAQVIEKKKTPGTNTYGTTSELVVDPAGVPVTIHFYVPTQVPIDIDITLSAKQGFVSTTGDLIKSQLAAYINQLGIGGSDNFVFNSKLYSPADDTGSLQNTYNVTVLTMRRDSNSFATTDIPIAFNELPVAGVITVTVV